MRMKVLSLMQLAAPYIVLHLHRKGVFVMIGVPNSQEEYEECLKNYEKVGGVDAIMTDRPALLRDYLKSAAGK